MYGTRYGCLLLTLQNAGFGRFTGNFFVDDIAYANDAVLLCLNCKCNMRPICFIHKCIHFSAVILK
jgi:hypothetical protein